MDNFKSIWNQLQCDSSKLQIAINGQKGSIFEKLKEEEELRKKFNPMFAVFIVLFSIGFSYVLFHNDPLSMPKIIGIGFITLASITIAVFAQIIKIPLDQFEHEKSSMAFLEMVKEKLDQSKIMLVVGVFLQVVFLTIGLYLIIFYASNDIQTGFFYIGIINLPIK